METQYQTPSRLLQVLYYLSKRGWVGAGMDSPSGKSNENRSNQIIREKKWRRIVIGKNVYRIGGLSSI